MTYDLWPITEYENVKNGILCISKLLQKYDDPTRRVPLKTGM